MKKYLVSEILKELNISRSRLYKIAKIKSVNIEKNDKGRYRWDYKSLKRIKEFINNDYNQEIYEEMQLIKKLGLQQTFINNRRYLGNKYSLSDFIKKTVEENCEGVKVFADLFSGTGSVSNIFTDKILITNDLLYSNYISNYAWFMNEYYDGVKIIELIYKYNSINTNENNYMRKNFANTFFSPDDCSKIGFIREDIERRYKNKELNFKEYAILITSLLHSMDAIANTVGHYDAYRKDRIFKKNLLMKVILPDRNVSKNNSCFNEDAGSLIKRIECDLLYLDPPYNSRQYSDAYHLLENVAKWQKPKVYGVAKKMDRSHIKSVYSLKSATEAFEKLIKDAKSKYILLSYNNMKTKGNDRSNAKIKDEDIIRILKSKGVVTMFEKSYKSFSAGKTKIKNNKERLFLCEVYKDELKAPRSDIASPLNYMGGKYDILKQIKPLFPESDIFLDLFAGGCNVGINAESSKIIFNDLNAKVIELIKYFKETKTNKIFEEIDNLISNYKLSNTYKNGYKYYNSNSNEGLSEYNRNKYLKLRDDYNNELTLGRSNPIMLYVLILFSFNNQIRFNRQGEFNLPVGKRDFNSKMRNKLFLFSEELKKKDINFMQKDFRDIKITDLPKNTFIYCDPPYLISHATYNENGMWTEKDEKDLLNFLDKLNAKGYKFALSNVLANKGKKNFVLKHWIEKNNYKCHTISKSYFNSNYQRKSKQKDTEEVLITNY